MHRWYGDGSRKDRDPSGLYDVELRTEILHRARAIVQTTRETFGNVRAGEHRKLQLGLISKDLSERLQALDKAVVEFRRRELPGEALAVTGWHEISALLQRALPALAKYLPESPGRREVESSSAGSKLDVREISHEGSVPLRSLWNHDVATRRDGRWMIAVGQPNLHYEEYEKWRQQAARGKPPWVLRLLSLPDLVEVACMPCWMNQLGPGAFSRDGELAVVGGQVFSIPDLTCIRDLGPRGRQRQFEEIWLMNPRGPRPSEGFLIPRCLGYFDQEGLLVTFQPEEKAWEEMVRRGLQYPPDSYPWSGWFRVQAALPTEVRRFDPETFEMLHHELQGRGGSGPRVPDRWMKEEDAASPIALGSSYWIECIENEGLHLQVRAEPDGRRWEEGLEKKPDGILALGDSKRFIAWSPTDIHCYEVTEWSTPSAIAES